MEAEEKLITRAAKGSERAFEALIRLYEVRVFSYAMTLIGNREDAEEVTQDVFVKVWQSLPLFRGEASFSTWIMRITRNAATDRLRARREETLPLYAEGEDGGEYELMIPDEDPDHNPPKAVAREETIETVRRAVANLPPDQREILILRDMEGYSYAALSELLEIEIGTVRSRLSRARENLKKILESWNFSP